MSVPSPADLASTTLESMAESGATPDCGGAFCCPETRRPLDEIQATRFAEDFALLSDPNRLRMLSLITTGGCEPVCAGDLVQPLGISQPTVSHHLKKLTDAGLLRREQDGRHARYTIVAERFVPLSGLLNVGPMP